MTRYNMYKATDNEGHYQVYINPQSIRQMLFTYALLVVSYVNNRFRRNVDNDEKMKKKAKILTWTLLFILIVLFCVGLLLSTAFVTESDGIRFIFERDLVPNKTTY